MNKKAMIAARVAELLELDELQDRIDRVAEDLSSGALRYAVIEAARLGDLLGVHFDDCDSWTRLNLGYSATEPSPVTLVITSLRSSSGLDLRFESTLSDGYPDGTAWSPYDIASGGGFDTSDYVLME